MIEDEQRSHADKPVLIANGRKTVGHGTVNVWYMPNGYVLLAHLRWYDVAQI